MHLTISLCNLSIVIKYENAGNWISVVQSCEVKLCIEYQHASMYWLKYLQAKVVPHMSRKTTLRTFWAKRIIKIVVKSFWLIILLTCIHCAEGLVWASSSITSHSNELLQLACLIVLHLRVWLNQLSYARQRWRINEQVNE